MPVKINHPPSLAQALCILFAIVNYKSLPFSHALKFYHVVIKNLQLSPNQTRQNELEYSKDELAIFKGDSWNTYCSILECDFYMHKSNSTYFIDLDHARTDHMTRKLYTFVKRFTGKRIVIPLSIVSAHFKRQITPFQKYQIFTEIFCWDHKAMFLISRFTTGSKDKKKLCCLSVARMVFRDTGDMSTIDPYYVVESAGYWNEKVAEVNTKRYELIKHYIHEPEQIIKMVAKL